MKSKPIFLSILAAGLVITATFLVYPVVFKSEAQNAPPSLKKQDEGALGRLRENARATTFFGKLNEKDPNLALLRFSGPSSIEDHKNINMVFKNGGEEISVSIGEYQSAEDAKAPLQIAVNADTKVYNDHGDEGIAIHSTHGERGFAGIAYRKDAFFVSIHCKDEAMARKMAGYAAETINQ